MLRTAPGGAGPPPNVRRELWSGGVERYRQLTGRTDSQARRRIGQLLRAACDDCARLLSAIDDCPDTGDPDSWIAAAAKPRRGNTWIDIAADMAAGRYEPALDDDNPLTRLNRALLEHAEDEHGPH